MSLLKWIGVRSYEEEHNRADGLFRDGKFGDAKLAYERALDKVEKNNASAKEELARRIEECCEAIAQQHIQTARELVAESALELALEELEHARIVAPSEARRREVAKLKEEWLRREFRAQQIDETAESPEARLAALAGSWEDRQAAEYEQYGDAFREALLAMHDEKYENARNAFESLLANATSPLFLYLEVGRARLALDELESGAEALRTFLSKLPEGEGGEARLTAHLELARLSTEREDIDGAIKELEGAVEALPDDPRPYLALGQFLRTHGHAEEALEVLESAQAVMGDARPEWRVIQEIGLTHADLGHDEQAIEFLESVLNFLASQRHYDFPAEAAAKLAELHESHGRKERAADLFRLLSSGSDKANRLRYCREAARLLNELGLKTEAREFLLRASELVVPDSDERKQLDEELAQLDNKRS